jgi:RNA polymerase sigma-70 factor (sigma-E family)
VSSQHDPEFTEYMAARMPALRRLARLLCQDWSLADDLLQCAMTKAYVHWAKATRADNIDAYVRGILVREFVQERRTSWARRVTLTEQPPDVNLAGADHESALDLRAAVAALPRRQRAVLVLRYFCDLNVHQAAEALGCSPGTIKSQTAKALETLRRSVGPGYDQAPSRSPARLADHPDRADQREVAGNA